MYAYQPLPDDRTIRVLFLDPGNDDDPLTGLLKAARLHGRREASATPQALWSTDQHYEAISYRWGSNIMEQTIFLDGKVHQITANLSDALHQCRLSDRRRALWADSICIDQKNLEEKGRQVALMGRIYSCSQRTLICLGTDPENRDHAQEALSVLSDVNEMMENTFRDPNFSWGRNSFPWPLPDDPLVDDTRWNSVSIMTELEWFIRGWVVQEVALGGEALVLWAGFEIPWLLLSRADIWYTCRVHVMGDKPHADRVDWYLQFLLNRPYAHRRRPEAITFHEANSEDHSILRVLDAARSLSIGDARDRIYAFMNLPFVKKPVPALQPDYEQPPMEIYRQFAIDYLRLTENLNILMCVDHQEQSLGQPEWSSWVPIWDSGAADVPSNALESVKGFGAKSTTVRTFTIINEKGSPSPYLQVRAVIFDSIKFASMPLDWDSAIEDVLAMWKEMKNLCWISPAHEDFNALHKCLHYVTALSNGYWYGSSREEWSERMHKYARFLDSADGQEADFTKTSNVPTGVQIFHEQTFNNYGKFKTFLLHRGYIGRGPWVIEEGDVCAFVFEVDRPLILRDVSEGRAHHFKVVGPAYVVSQQLNEHGTPIALNQLDDWYDWDQLCKGQGWEHLSFKAEDVILE